MSMAGGGQHCNTWFEERVGGKKLSLWRKEPLSGVFLRLFDRLMVVLFYCKPEPIKFPSPLISSCTFSLLVQFLGTGFLLCPPTREHLRKEKTRCPAADRQSWLPSRGFPRSLANRAAPACFTEMKDHPVTSFKSIKYC